tara:strand:- start:6938 stop:7585 length:648 start_codon:yes stop_codon:yes gene_type:complete
MVRVSKPVALQTSENAFIEKTLHYISSIRGCVNSGLVLSTNTRFPRRYILAIRGMPAMSIEDFQNIRDTNDHIRDILISTADELVRIDVWRTGKQPNRKKKRRRPKESVVTTCDLSSVDQCDRKCLRQLLLRLNAMPEIECQFQVRVDTSQPDFYKLEVHVLDRVSLLSLETILHECRAFCHDIEFDFPHNLIRIKCLKVAAPLRPRKILRVKNK